MLNKVFLVGNLGQEPTTPEDPEQAPRAALSVATDRFWKNADGERQKATDWHRVVAFGGLAEFVAKLAKGQLVLVEGRLQTRSYEQDGETRYITEVVASRVTAIGKPSRSDAAPTESSKE